MSTANNTRCKRTEAEIARALYGNWRDEHLFALSQALELYEFYQARLRECDAKLEAYLKTFEDQSGGKKLGPKSKRNPRKANDPAFDVRGSLYRMCGADLTVIAVVATARKIAERVYRLLKYGEEYVRRR